MIIKLIIPFNNQREIMVYRQRLIVDVKELIDQVIESNPAQSYKLCPNWRLPDLGSNNEGTKPQIA